MTGISAPDVAHEGAVEFGDDELCERRIAATVIDQGVRQATGFEKRHNQ